MLNKKDLIFNFENKTSAFPFNIYNFQLPAFPGLHFSRLLKISHPGLIWYINIIIAALYF